MNLALNWAAHPGWLLRHSLQAGVLVLLVLLVQWLFRGQLTNRWRFALWWIVLARLLLPFGPESAVSLFNVFRPAVQWTNLPSSTSSMRSTQSKSPSVSPESSLVGIPHSEILENEMPSVDISETVANVPPAHFEATPLPVKSQPVLLLAHWLVPGLTALWLAGVLGLFAAVAVQFLRFQRKLATGSRPADPALCALLEECCREFGTTHKVELLETDAVQSPALFGLWRLQLLLPPGLAGQFPV